MTGTLISGVHARRVWDSRGRPTVEAELLLGDGSIGRAIAPAGASRGSGEATDLRDGGRPFAGYDVNSAVAAARGLSEYLVGVDATDQKAVDTALATADPSDAFSVIGGNTAVAMSMAAAHAAAATHGIPLWRYLIGDRTAAMPLPEIQVIGGGAHAARRTDVQDFMVVPAAADSIEQGLNWVAEIHRACGALLSEQGRLAGVADEGGWWPVVDSNEDALELLVASIERAGLQPGAQVTIALDIASSEFGSGGRYRLGLDGTELDSDAWAEVLIGWIDKYPIASIEDPLAEDDPAALAEFTQAVGHRVLVVGDDFTVTNAGRVLRATEAGACNGLLVKPNQAGTLSAAKSAHDTAHDCGWDTIVSARSGESEDVTIAHLAVGWGAEQLKVGSITRSERTAKWNELLRIDEQLGGAPIRLGRLTLG
ncbi:phosphopyruvate hydratase [Mycobacteroides salmoniphilum]|uniref:phosphopyruvate hydratase n=1 Tax=Mycobacteroides salmoniphilum TaxID=404941 RepID=UPI0009932585|nr:enolase C-terminal domain-like protein [Mycobacteroides salmoniphilum]TDZ94916.1 Enolase [Mycobacteroides salmoniphilum]